MKWLAAMYKTGEACVQVELRLARLNVVRLAHALAL